MRRIYYDIQRFRQRIGFYAPFTWYFVLFSACLYLSYKWLKSHPLTPNTPSSDIYALLLKVAVFVISVFLVVSFLSVLVSWLIFVLKKRSRGVDALVQTLAIQQNKANDNQPLQISVHPILKPLLGFLKLRLQYDEDFFSEKFALVEKKKNKFFNTDFEGIYYWKLPEIKEYHVDKVFVYFEDYFQFFSFTTTLPTTQRFYTSPKETPLKEQKIAPRKTENADIRIEEIKKIEGEYLNYKNFENNDDVRRIVWKIYAKNKELVVRIPEVLDPYASHIYLYPSFYTSFDINGSDVINVPFLNYYKTFVWSAYRELLKKGFEVRYVADQVAPTLNTADIEQQVKYTISTSNWQTDKNLPAFIKPREASAVIVTSLSNAEEVEQLLDNYGNDVVVLFAQLSNGLKSQGIADWLQWVFVQQEKDEIAKYKTSWAMSSLRLKLLQNEKKIKKILEDVLIS